MEDPSQDNKFRFATGNHWQNIPGYLLGKPRGVASVLEVLIGPHGRELTFIPYGYIRMRERLWAPWDGPSRNHRKKIAGRGLKNARKCACYDVKGNTSLGIQVVQAGA